VAVRPSSKLQASKNEETQELTFTAVTARLTDRIDFIGNVESQSICETGLEN
jgi:hypothetical protein